MSRAFSTRRADQFDALLEGTLAEAPSAELASLLALAEDLRSVPEVSPGVDFAAGLRERLMAEAPTALAVPAPDATDRLSVRHRPPATARRERRLAAVAAAFSIVGATGVSAVASQGALPGDTLYPVKRIVEDVRSSLAMGDTARADVLLTQARTRLSEARDLGRRDDVDTGAVEQALGDFGDSAESASTILLADYADHGDQRAIGDLRTFTSEGITELSELADLLPGSLNGVLAEATDTLLSIDHSAAEACPACGGGITELPTPLIDLLAATTGDGDSADTAAVPRTANLGTVPRASSPTAPAASAGALPGPLTDPLKNLTNGSAGTGSHALPTAPPSSIGDAVGQVGGAVGGTVGGLGGAVSGLGGQVDGPVGGVLGGAGGALTHLGNTVDGTVSGLGNTVDGVAGGATGTSPTP